MSDKVSRISLSRWGASLFLSLFTHRIKGLNALTTGVSQGELATLIDKRKCIGCEACVDACREVNEKKIPRPVKPFPRMIQAG